MSKGLEIINKWRAQIHWQNDFGWNKELDTVEKELKTLEIIKEKGLDIREFRYAFSLYEYNICKNIGCKELTQEEYDLLKEVLL